MTAMMTILLILYTDEVEGNAMKKLLVIVFAALAFALLGDEVYIGLAMDFHASNDPRMPEMVNVIRNYRTVPHADQPRAE